MKKTLIAAALAALGCSAVQAQSQVNLRGLYDVYFGQVKTAGNTANVVNSGGMSTSYWGIGGSEDLGNGLKINMGLDGFFRGDNGQGGRFNGDSFFARARQAPPAERVGALPRRIEDLTASEGKANSSVAGLRARAAELATAAGMSAVAGPTLTVTLDDAPPGRVRAGFRPDELVVHQQDLQAVVNALWAGGAGAK